MTSVKLASGHLMPLVGLGTWKSKAGEVEKAVEAALRCGYRHIDCAFIYGNEAEVGVGVKTAVSARVCKREDIFITSKVWNTFHRPDLVGKQLEESLKRLDTPYVDLLLIHWPMAYKEGDELFPKDADGNFLYSDVDLLDTWKALEELVDAGKVKSIGLSNCNSKQVARICEAARHKCSVNQVELHVYLQQHKLVEACHKLGVQVTAYSPFCSPDRPPHLVVTEQPTPFEDPVILEIAKTHNKSPAQVIVRWMTQRNIVVIPKSVTPARIAANFDVFNFELSAGEVDKLNGLEKGLRLIWLSAVKSHKEWPFHEDF